MLPDFTPDPNSPYPEAAQHAVHLARALQQRATELQTPQERRQQAELDRMIQNPKDKVTLTQMTDQAFRSSRPYRAADQLVHILDVQGIPRFFSPLDRTLLKGFQSFGSYLPGVAVPLVKEKMHQETANVILPAEHDVLRKHLESRRAEGVRMNVNHLGEALLGEREAERRLQAYLQMLQMPVIEVISVKISTIYSQIWPIAREHTVQTLCDRLELLYRAASKATFTRGDGTVVPKFVYLDMEEYRDMAITSEVFMRTLDRPGLESASAGIVLQAYIPDAYPMQQRIVDWARQRVKTGGGPITMRIVKGANMEMERVEASLRGWPQAPYQVKSQTDANFKRMVAWGMQSENRQAVSLGIASHNLFDLAYGLVLASRENAVDGSALDQVQFEMLEGMANHQRRALFELCQNLLLYAPACKQEDFIHAIGYLIRRLDENTGPENFLRHAFNVQVGSPEWEKLEQGFLRSFDAQETLSDAPRKTQDRRQPPHPIQAADVTWQDFQNEPDTDFSLVQNTHWAESVVDAWRDRCDENATWVPLVFDGQESAGPESAGPEKLDDRSIRKSMDPSRPGVVVARFRQASEDEIQRAVACARRDPDGWRSMSNEKCSEILSRVAQELRLARADLMGAALAEGGKTLMESDPEVSEAVDFVEFYSRSSHYFSELPGVTATGKGVVAVVSPWNFPIAIPCGGVAAALAAGNTVLLKPATDSVLIAYRMCQAFWDAGVPRTALQFVPCSGATVGAKLVAHDEVDVVILTGGTETAWNMLNNKPAMRLLAETGGKNATIVTAMSDRDQTIKNVIHSAFSHSGQKCSATSLLILEEEVYHDPRFKAALCDAVESLHVGSAWELHSRMGPLIRPPSGDLEAALKELEPGESWAVMPHSRDGNPNLITPAVKWDVQPGGKTHMTEFFGPVLGVMCAKDLPEAIDLVNATGFGLTSGLESLDDREQELWRDSIRAGNLYINRSTTGAIVLRQPFGGMGKSAFGPGIKAGGPNYVAQLMDFQETTLKESGSTGATAGSPSSVVTKVPQLSPSAPEGFLPLLADSLRNLSSENGPWPAELIKPEEIDRVLSAIASYEHSMREEFSQSHDHMRLIGEENSRRYLPMSELRIRVTAADSLFETLARVCAAHAAGCRTTLSYEPSLHDSPLIALVDELTQPWAAAIELVEESDERLAEILRDRQTDRVRYAAPDRVPTIIREAVIENGIYLADTPVMTQGRIELLWYLQEQSLSISYHRYGNLGARSGEERAEPV